MFSFLKLYHFPHPGCQLGLLTAARIASLSLPLTLAQPSVASRIGQSNCNNFLKQIAEFLSSILDPGEVPEIRGVTRWITFQGYIKSLSFPDVNILVILLKNWSAETPKSQRSFIMIKKETFVQ